MIHVFAQFCRKYRGELRTIYTARKWPFGRFAQNYVIPVSEFVRKPSHELLLPLENGTCKVDSRVHDEPALSQPMGSMPILPPFLRISLARFVEGKYSRRSFRLP